MSRAMRLDVRAWLAAGALACVLAGCFGPQYPAGLVCSERQTCPPGQTCDGEICRLPILDAAPADASFDGAVADASELDAAELDAAVDDAADDAAVDGAPPDASTCGNGVREGGEGCDDGNTTDDGNGCSAGCESSPLAGCADGVRDAFLGLDRYPSIAACAGAWTTPGLHVDPSGCLGGGDDSPAGTPICAAADLCAPGWHICAGRDEVARYGGTSACTDAVPASHVFYATRQSSPEAGRCSEPGTNDVFGCGDWGSQPDPGCAPLNRFSGNLCEALWPDWDCDGDPYGELLTVIKPDSDGGGVLCCN